MKKNIAIFVVLAALTAALLGNPDFYPRRPASSESASMVSLSEISVSIWEKLSIELKAFGEILKVILPYTLEAILIPLLVMQVLVMVISFFQIRARKRQERGVNA